MKKKGIFLLLSFMAAAFVFAQDEGSRLLDLLDSALEAAEGSRLAPSPVPSQGSAENSLFNILNKTGFTIKTIFISSEDSGAGETTIFNGNLYNDQSARINLNIPGSKTSRYKIRLVDADGDWYSKYDVDISASSVIVITISDFEF
jgi:hypothetical protein